MKKIIVVLLVLFFINFEAIFALETIVFPTGEGKIEYLEKTDMTLVNNNINFNVPGSYQVTYFSNTLNSFVYSDVNVINENVLSEGFSRTGSKSLNNDKSFILRKTLYLGKSEYFLIGELDFNYNNPNHKQDRWPKAYIEYYNNDHKIWTRTFNEEPVSLGVNDESRLIDGVLSENGVLLCGSYLVDGIMNNWLLEIDTSNHIIRSKIFEEPYQSCIQTLEIENTVVKICGTRSDINNTQQMIYFKLFNYYDFSLITEVYFGNNGYNLLQKAMFYNNQLYALVKFTGTSGTYDANSKYTFLGLVNVDDFFNAVNYVELDYDWTVDSLTAANGEVYVLGKKKIGEYWNFFIEKFGACIYDGSTSCSWMHDQKVSSIYAGLLSVNSKGDLLLCYGSYKDSNVVNIVKMDKEGIVKFHYKYTVPSLEKVKQVEEINDQIRITYETSTLGKAVNNHIYLTYIKIIKTSPEITDNYIKTAYDVCVNGALATEKTIKPKQYNKYGDYVVNTFYEYGDTKVLVNRDLFIKPKISLNNNETYNTDVKLTFNGKGYLNNNLIESGFTVKKDGNYSFKLLSNSSEETVINFIVSDLCYDDNDFLKAAIFNDFLGFEENPSDNPLYSITYKESGETVEDKSNIETVFLVLIFTLVGGLLAYFLPFKAKLVVVLLLAILFINVKQVNASPVYQDQDTNADYVTIFEGEGYKLKSTIDERISIDFYEDGILVKELDLNSIASMPKIFKVNDNLVVMYVNPEYYLTKIIIGPNKEIISKQRISECKYNKEISWLCYEDKIYLVGCIININFEYDEVLNGRSIKGRAAFVIKFDSNLEIEKRNIYGGEKNEFFSSITVLNNYLYILGEKSHLAGGDFQNGGRADKCNMVLAKVSLDLELLEYKIITSASRSINIFTFGEDLIVLGDNVIASFTKELYCKYFSEIPKINCAFKTIYDKLLILEDYKICLYNPFTSLKEEEYEITDDLSDVKFYSDFDNLKLYFEKDGLRCKEVEIFNLDEYKEKIVFQKDEDSSIVLGLFKEVAVLETKEENYFAPNIFGEYKSTNKYKSGSLDDLILEKTVEVPLRVNVREKETYCLGYNLFFTGAATLNGESIVNNYTLLKLNDNKLILEGLNKTVEINFYVENLLISYSDDFYLDWDCEFQKNEAIKFDVMLSDLAEWNVLGVVINDEYHTNFTVSGNKIEVTLPSISQSGVHNFFVSKVYLEKGAYKHQVIINENIVIRILKEKVYLNCILEKKVLNVNLLDYEKCVRYLECVLISDTETFKKIVTFKNQNIYFENLNNDSYQGVINLLCDYGNNNLVAIEIARVNIASKGDVKIASFNVLKGGTSLEEFSLDFNKSTLSAVTSGANSLDLTKGKMGFATFALASGMCAICFALVFVFKKYVFKKM